MTTTLKSALALMLVAAVTVGCKNVQPVTSGMGTDQMAAQDNFAKHLEVHNPELGAQLKITDVKTRETNDLLEVNLALTSTYEKSLQLQYHFNWFDKDGFVIESRKSPWKPLDLHGFQTTTLRGLAPSTEVASFSVYVRYVPEKYYKF